MIYKKSMLDIRARNPHQKVQAKNAEHNGMAFSSMGFWGHVQEEFLWHLSLA